MASLTRKTRLTGLVLALCLLLSGCRGQPLNLGAYPRPTPEEQTAPLPQKQTLTLVLPEGAPDSLLNATYLLESKLSQLSGGQVALERQWAAQGLSMSAGDWDLALFTNEDLIDLEPELGFLSAPFLFPDRESFLTVLSQEDGPVLGSRSLRTALGGRILALYYGGAMGLLCRTRLYDGLGFHGAAVGVLDTAAHTADFYRNLPELSARTVEAADQQTLLARLGSQDQPLRYVEYPRGMELPEAYRQQASYYEDTQHRFLGYWLTVADGVDPQVTEMIREAVSYTVGSAQTEQLAYEDWVMADLPPAAPDNLGHPALRGDARILYMAPDLRVGISQQMWGRLRTLLD